MSIDQKNRKTVFLACGGTGGHIFPAFSVAEELSNRRPDLRILYVCGDKDIESTIFKSVPKEKFAVINSAPYRGILSFVNPLFLLKLLQGVLKAKRLLDRERPELVVGFGGYFSFPMVLMAKRKKIRTIVHEQNVVPGTANRYLAPRVDAVALSYAKTEKLLPKCRRIQLTGNPIRASIEKDCTQEALDFFEFGKDRVTVLVLGGSQGAESINHYFLGSLKFISKEIRRRLQVLHLCGRMDPEQAQRYLTEAGVKSKAFSFFDRMDLAYSVTDFAVGRAGATFLAEIKAKNIPAILVPYPYGRAHQLENALAFQQEGCATIIEQKDLEFVELAEEIEKYIQRIRDKQANAVLVEPRFALGSKGSSGKDKSSPRLLLAGLIEEFTVK